MFFSHANTINIRYAKSKAKHHCTHMKKKSRSILPIVLVVAVVGIIGSTLALGFANFAPQPARIEKPIEHAASAQ
jgi:hypothetical protein